MSRIIRMQFLTLSALVTALVVTLAACGGGSSSAGSGGGSGSTIAGTVNSGTAAVNPSGTTTPLFAAALDLLIEPANAAGIAGITVELLDDNGAVVGTQTTGGDGRFLFGGLAPGSYSIRLSQDGAQLGQTRAFLVGPNSRAEVQLDLNGGILSVEVETEGDQVEGEIEDGQSDDGSLDDDSADLDSTDDESIDDDSTDDQSNDDDDSGATT